MGKRRETLKKSWEKTIVEVPPLRL